MTKLNWALGAGMGMTIAFCLGVAEAGAANSGTAEVSPANAPVAGDTSGSALVPKGGTAASRLSATETPEAKAKRAAVLQELKAVQTASDKRDDKFIKESRAHDKKRREEEAAARSRAELPDSSLQKASK